MIGHLDKTGCLALDLKYGDLSDLGGKWVDSAQSNLAKNVRTWFQDSGIVTNGLYHLVLNHKMNFGINNSLTVNPSVIVESPDNTHKCSIISCILIVIC